MDKKRLVNLVSSAQGLHESRSTNEVRCVICWASYGWEDVDGSSHQILTVEDIVPKAAIPYLAESELLTVTCRKCNNELGSFADSHLVRYRSFVDQVRRKRLTLNNSKFGISGASSIRGTAEISGNAISLIGIPKLNHPEHTQSQVRRLDATSTERTSDWIINLEFSPGYVPGRVLLGYLKAAYLFACIASAQAYAYSDGARYVRHLLQARDPWNTPRAVITSNGIMSRSRWIGRIHEPSQGSCIAVKIAGEIVLLPNTSDGGERTYKYWSSAGEVDGFGVGIRPNGTKLQMDFDSVNFYDAAKIDLMPLLNVD